MVKLLKAMLSSMVVVCILSTVLIGSALKIDRSDKVQDNTVLLETNVPTITTKHIPYLLGLPDGSFHPNEPMTRGQAAQIIYRLLSEKTSDTRVCSYRDIEESDWYYKAITTLCSLGLLDESTTFRPKDKITRAEFLDILTRFVPSAKGDVNFSDVPKDYWAAKQIETAAALGWISGNEDGRFCPDDSITRAQACKIINRMAGRIGDHNLGRWMVNLGLYSDVNTEHWAWNDIVEASVNHTFYFSEDKESWGNLNLNEYNFSSGFYEINGLLYYVDRAGRLARNTTLGAYQADEFGALTLMSSSFQMSNVPYISQLDNIFAWVGCEPVSALMGMKTKGFASNINTKEFLDGLPLTASNPAKGFVGSPYRPDTTKKTRTTIYPPILAQYCNTFCGGENLCSDFSGSTLKELQRELLAGNCVVAYMTMSWEKPFYRSYNIEGEYQWLVSNNHAVLVCGYDAEKGYYICDPYNYYNKNQIYEYWESSATFDYIWNQRKVGMVLR